MPDIDKPETPWMRLKSSAKFWTGLSGLLLTAATSSVLYFGLEFTPAQVAGAVQWILYVTMTLVGAQGMAGFGKEKAIEERKTAVTVAAINAGQSPEDAIAAGNASAKPVTIKGMPVIKSDPSAGAGPGVSTLLVLLLSVAIAGGTSTGCTHDARRDTIHATLVATDTLHAGFVAWDLEHQLAIVAAAKTEAEGRSALDAYRHKRDRVVELLIATLGAISTAAILDNDSSASGMLSAASSLRDAYLDLTKDKP